MKKPLFTAAIVSALIGCSAPVTSYAADFSLLSQGDGYAVFVGQGTDCLPQAIKDICESLEGSGLVCPQQPDLPTQPDIQKPDTPTVPDIQKPDIPALPDVQEPDTQKPDVPVWPDVQEPDAEAPSEEAFHAYALQILKLVNAERAKAGLSQLKLDENVTAAANVRAMEITQSFSHTRPDGSSFSSALTQQGISYRRSGENIAWGQKSPEQVMDGWMNSDGHRANILNAGFENIGIGYYQDANGVNYWVQLFTA